MNRYKASGEFGRPVAEGRLAACWVGVFLAMAMMLFHAVPATAQGPGEQRSAVGSAAADFTLPDVDGRQVRLSDFRGKTVLLAFWATWCLPCKEELPTLQKIDVQYRDKGLVILTINDEAPATIRDFLRAKHYSLPALVDSNREVFREFAVHFIPTAVVINPDEIVTQVMTGWEGPERLLEALRAAGLGKVPPAPAQPSNPGNLQRTMIAISKQETNS
jgi:peroxiredoxin